MPRLWSGEAGPGASRNQSYTVCISGCPSKNLTALEGGHINMYFQRLLLRRHIVCEQCGSGWPALFHKSTGEAIESTSNSLRLITTARYNRVEESNPVPPSTGTARERSMTVKSIPVIHLSTTP